MNGQDSRLSLIRQCEVCVGTGSLESSDSTDDRWWDCGTCKGTGKIEFEDRRAPDPRLAGAVEALETIRGFDDAALDAVAQIADTALAAVRGQ